jgi:hypothetical protein
LRFFIIVMIDNRPTRYIHVSHEVRFAMDIVILHIALLCINTSATTCSTSACRLLHVIDKPEKTMRNIKHAKPNGYREIE